MKRASQNELLGTVALQSALTNSEGQRLSLAKAMLVLPLLYDKAVRSVLKKKNSVVLSSMDLLINNPTDFIVVRSRYEDLTIVSLNTILLSQEIGMATCKDGFLNLQKEIYAVDDDIGGLAKDILAAGPKLGVLLGESAEDLYQTLRIDL